MSTEQSYNSGIRPAIISDVENRIRSNRVIPSFVVDCLSRMHPADLADDAGLRFDLFEDVSESDYRAEEPSEARDEIAYRLAPIIAPYQPPLDLRRQTKVHPLVLDEIGIHEVAVGLANQRDWLMYNNFLPMVRVISEELFTDTDDQLNIRDAIGGFFEYLGQTVPDQVIDDRIIINTTGQLGRPSSETTDERFEPEIIVCIPVANGEEHETLPRTLELLARQSLDPSKYEIVLLHNTKVNNDVYDAIAETVETLPTDFSAEQEDEFMWAVHLYESLINRFPDLNVRAQYAIHGPHARIGYCRQRIAEDVAHQYVDRKSTNNPLLLSMDADITTISSEFLQNIIVTSKQTDARVISSRLRWKNPEVADRNSQVGKLLRFERFMYVIAAGIREMPPYMDSGNAIRLKEYCLTGGHHWFDQFSENINIIQLLEKINITHGKGPAVLMSEKSIFSSHPRRQVDVMARGHAPIKAWRPEVTTFGKEDDEVRTQAMPIQLAEDQATSHSTDWIENIIVESIGELDSDSVLEKKELIRKALSIIGLPDIFLK